mgnify:CR=1 FL=1
MVWGSYRKRPDEAHPITFYSELYQSRNDYHIEVVVILCGRAKWIVHNQGLFFSHCFNRRTDAALDAHFATIFVENCIIVRILFLEFNPAQD